MKVKHFFAGAVLIALLMVGVTYMTSSEAPDPAEAPAERYVATLLSFREKKDQHFRGEESPIENPREFGGLRYFEPDTAFRVDAEWRPADDAEPVLIHMTDGKEEAFVRAGTAAFTLNEIPLMLTLFRRTDARADEALFLPFTDATNGTDTYGGGRYLDVPAPKGSVLVLDFNFAYNPYCAYNYNYSCPVPPRANHIDIPIPVGERSYPETKLSVQ
ncbi:MAG: DUF1684 domain-containing protein [Catalinimonas sp.]